MADIGRRNRPPRSKDYMNGYSAGYTAAKKASERKLKPHNLTDMVIVRHAYWQGTDFDGYADGYPVWYLWECSNCHEEYEEEGEPPHWKFCPNCGAIMDGEPEE